MTTLKEAEQELGAWMSAALGDTDVCDAMKADIINWFDAMEERDIKEQRRENATVSTSKRD